MGKYSEVFLAFDVAKKKHAVAMGEGGRTGEVRFMGDVGNNPVPSERRIKRLANTHSHGSEPIHENGDKSLINRRLSLRSQLCAVPAFFAADGRPAMRPLNRAFPLDREHKRLAA
jgi:hypothetical protein